MNLELNPHEFEIIHQLVAQAVRELGPEIHHTHSRQVRDRLSERRQTLEMLLDRLAERSHESAVAHGG